MGAWGLGCFENDDALDWVIDLLEEDDLTPILTAFSGLAESDYIELPESAAALATAEVVAALRGNPAINLPDDVTAWVSSHSLTVNKELVEDAQGAVEQIRNKSELRDLVEDSQSLNEWQTILDDLIFRLR